MLWYGFFIYSFVLIAISYSLFLLTQALVLRSNYKLSIISNIDIKIPPLFLLFFLLSLLNSYGVLQVTNHILVSNIDIISRFSVQNISSVSYNFPLTRTYSFPFILIFTLITFLSIIFCLAYNVNEFKSFSFYCAIITIAGAALLIIDSLTMFFLFYEFLLLPSFFILYRFAKTRRSIEASYLMFFWTQFGALFLIFSLIYLMFITSTYSFSIASEFQFSAFDANFLFLCWIIGFGVKLPLWPFYGWLPKAHVEASTNFSIFLSGVLVKFAFFGLLKCLFTVQIEPSFIFILPFLFLGIVDASFKLFYQLDLKKLVAYSTVVEMHWLTFCIISGQTSLMLSGFCMLISHALLSSNSFLLVDAINRRFKTRLISEIQGLNLYCPKLFIAALINCLIFLGFPGSIFFIAEFLFFGFFFDVFPLLTLLLLILLYFLVPTFFFRSWMNLFFGTSEKMRRVILTDLSSLEITIFFGISTFIFWLGLSWQFFIF